MGNDYISLARYVFEVEAKALINCSERVGDDFSTAISSILKTKGRVVISGMGKSGIVGKKIAATLASTGTPSFFMHPGEAYHGDLGMVTSNDVFIAISNSGETDEVLKIIPFLRDNGNFLIALTGNPLSSLALSANCHLYIGVEEEACPLNLAPTSSTTVTMAMGDAIAITLMKAKGFQPENFARFHPGGSLGRRLLRRVEDEMISENLPYLDDSSSVVEVLSAITNGGLGVALIRSAQGVAIITDGDVRRVIDIYKEGVFSKTARDFMTVNPTGVAIGTRIEDAFSIMEQKKITSLLVFDRGEVVGVFKK